MLAAAAFAYATAAAAQEPPTRVPLPADSVRVDTIAPDTIPGDSLSTDSIPKDTIKASIAVAPRGTSPEVSGRRTVWDRDAIFAIDIPADGDGSPRLIEIDLIDGYVVSRTWCGDAPAAAK